MNFFKWSVILNHTETLLNNYTRQQVRNAETNRYFFIFFILTFIPLKWNNILLVFPLFIPIAISSLIPHSLIYPRIMSTHFFFSLSLPDLPPSRSLLPSYLANFPFFYTLIKIRAVVSGDEFSSQTVRATPSFLCL